MSGKDFEGMNGDGGASESPGATIDNAREDTNASHDDGPSLRADPTAAILSRADDDGATPRIAAGAGSASGSPAAKTNHGLASDPELEAARLLVEHKRNGELYHKYYATSSAPGGQYLEAPGLRVARGNGMHRNARRHVPHSVQEAVRTGRLLPPPPPPRFFVRRYIPLAAVNMAPDRSQAQPFRDSTVGGAAVLSRLAGVTSQKCDGGSDREGAGDGVDVDGRLALSITGNRPS